ncbi:Mpv17/PMP22 family protein [Photobacterium damselae]|uniref:Mpv17/PMP22 family protein n=1 Tax=Photobacterium damselae TaxID=38293 RepID=UPI003B67659A
MKKDDCFLISIIALFVSILYFTPTLSSTLSRMTSEHAYIMSGLKFSLLATFGEVLGKRISSGNWNIKNFGLIPKAIVWFFLGMLIKVGFVIFATGMPAVLKTLDVPTENISNALAISIGLNLIFAPIFMTIHKITDMHIGDFNGSLNALIHPIDMAKKFSQVNWNMQYGFVFKKTIPFFWIPAHTITFLLPEAFQVIFAAILGVILGVILSVASNLNTSQSAPC